MQTAGALVGRQIADPVLGTGQGSPLSPFLANVYLLPFDRAMEAAGFECVRYGDDLCVATVARVDAERAFETARRALGRLRLALNTQKVEVRHRSEGSRAAVSSAAQTDRKVRPNPFVRMKEGALQSQL